MAIRNFFKKDPEADLDRRQSLRDPEQILAWLEELARQGTPVEVGVSESDLAPILAKVRVVVEDTRICSLAFKWKPGLEPSSGQKMRMVFPMDRQRFQADLVYVGRGNYLEYRFRFPSAIFSAERRDSVRVKMRPRDDLSILALQDLFDGVGFTGTLVDLSIGGCGFLLQRAIRIKGEERLNIHPDLLAPGTPLVLVRLPNLPHLPRVECGGYLCSMRATTAGVVVGLRFAGLGPGESAILGKFLSDRDPGITFGFPHKRRRLQGEEDVPWVEPTPAEAEAAAKAEADAGPKPEIADPDPGEDSEDLAESGAGELVGQAPRTDQDRLKQLRKRGKRILLVIADELERVALMALLQNDGYRSLFEAHSLIEALERNRKVPLDLVVMGQEIGRIGALKLLDLLRENGLPREARVVVLQTSIDHQLTLAVKGGKMHLLVPRPLDFEGTLKQPLETILGL
jgi:CheY-like chemotaxis protein